MVDIAFRLRQCIIGSPAADSRPGPRFRPAATNGEWQARALANRVALGPACPRVGPRDRSFAGRAGAAGPVRPQAGSRRRSGEHSIDQPVIDRARPAEAAKAALAGRKTAAW